MLAGITYFYQKIMMRFYQFVVLGLFIFLIGCRPSTESKTFVGVDIDMIYIDTVSIRALLPVDKNRVWFAGNQGKVGLIDHRVPKIAHFSYQDSLLQFRAIARTESNVLVVSIGNPAIIYQIGFDGLQATSVKEVYFEQHERVFYNAVKFFNDKEGIAMGDPTDSCLSILITRDGGHHWEKITCDQLPPLVEGEAGYAASNSNIAIYGDAVWIATGGSASRVYYSPDKGHRWQVFDTPIIRGGKMTGIYSIDFYDANLGIVFGGDWENMNDNRANKAITHDGGKTWNLISDGSGPGYRSSVRFVPGRGGQEIVAVGSPGISYSSDAGVSWKSLSEEGFFAIEFVNDTLAFASGNNKIAQLTFY